MNGALVILNVKPSFAMIKAVCNEIALEVYERILKRSLMVKRAIWNRINVCESINKTI